MKQSINYDRSESAALQRLRREKRRQRRQQQINEFFESMSVQNADKVIFLFDNDLDIA